MDMEKVKQLRLPSNEGGVQQSGPESGRWRVMLTVLAVISAFVAGWLLRPVRDPGVAAQRMADDPVNNQPRGDVFAGATNPAAAGPTFTATGYIEPMPPYPVKVTPLVSGRLELFEVIEGATVTQDSVIAILDSSALERRAKELHAARAVTTARIEHARSMASRAERLAEIGSVSQREREQAQADVAVLHAEASRLEEEIASVTWEIDNTRIIAPVAGVLYERLADSGQWVGPGHESAIASIYDPARLQVWVDVNQRDASRVRVGQRIEVSMDAEPDRLFEGYVARILPRASIAKNTFRVNITLEEVSESMRPDMSVRVSFLSGTGASSVKPE
jgi:RND family efflux transporter MFP subunit